MGLHCKGEGSLWFPWLVGWFALEWCLGFLLESHESTMTLLYIVLVLWKGIYDALSYHDSKIGRAHV